MWNVEQTQEVQKDHESTWNSWLSVVHAGAKMLLHVKERPSLREMLMIFFSYTHRDNTMQSNIHSLMVQWQWESFCLPEDSRWNKDSRQGKLSPESFLSTDWRGSPESLVF